MIYQNKNWNCKNPKLEDGDIIEGGNLGQLLPNTLFDGHGAENVIVRPMVGVHPKTLKEHVYNGNRTNCVFPASWTYEGTPIRQVSSCYWVCNDERLPVEPEDCPHVKIDEQGEKMIDTVELSGETTTIYHRHESVEV